MPTMLRSLVFAVLSTFAMTALAWSAPLSPDSVEIDTVSGPHSFAVEVMRTQAELEKGLMFRRHMAPDAGMLFDFGPPQRVSMWMKNTYLPLDMVFIGKDGRVVSVKQNAEPLSERIIPSGGEITGVLELNAGIAERIGVKAGDQVHHPMFGS